MITIDLQFFETRLAIFIYHADEGSAFNASSQVNASVH